MDIKQIAEKIKNAGGRLYLVGGAIRDKLLRIESFDEDYVVVGLTSDEFKALFPEAFSRGKSFEVWDIGGKEFALARMERKTGTGHKEFEIDVGKDITIEEDLKRRDITINAIAEDVLTGKIIDPFNGREDLENKAIRAVSDSFSEDPLRVYRVARLASKLEFEVDENTIKLMHKLKPELNTLSAERVCEELKKALSSKKPSMFFEVLQKADVLQVHFIEIYDLIGKIQPEKYHPEGDSFVHTMIVVDEAAKQTENLEIRFSALVHDLGKGITPKEILPHHYGHDKNGVKLVQNLGNRLKLPQKFIKCGKVSAKEHMLGGLFQKLKPSKKVDFLDRVSKSMLGLEGLQIVVNSDRMGREDAQNFVEVGNKMLKEIDGEYVMRKYNLKPGLELKEKLRQERIEWFRENFNNKKRA
ncbi:MAG: HD domain-containing protein [Clostridia bacterium]|nr:HD domain-containing protein [Clostridia bacterium]